MRVFFALLSMVLASGCVTKISGALVDDLGKPVVHEHGKVNITRLDARPGQSFQEAIAVEEDGSFNSVAEVAPGRYLVEALVPGFRAVSVRVDVKESKHLQLVLSPIPRVRSTTIRTNMDIEVGRGAGAATINPPSL